MGVPTMLPDIMASGLQKPRSVILARFCLSSCTEEQTQRYEARHTEPDVNQTRFLTRTFFSLMSRCRRP